MKIMNSTKQRSLLFIQAILPNSVLSFSILDLSEQSRNYVPA